jgi:hypothetical protein
MARPPWPLTCNRCGTRWESRAKGGNSTPCPGCGTWKDMPRNRPETDAEARAQRETPPPRPDTAAVREPAGTPALALVQAWERVPEWSDDLGAVMWREDPGAGTDPDCGQARVAEPGRTMVACPPCGNWDDYPEVIAWRDRQAAAAANASAGPARAGPGELDQVAEECAVALDEITRVRELLSGIPRDDDWREDAVRALHRLRRLAEQYDSARSVAELAAADQAAVKLLGDDSAAGELAGVLRRADRLTRHQGRQDRGGFLRFTRRGDDDEYAYEADEDQAGDDTSPQRFTVRPAAAPAPPCSTCIALRQHGAAVARIAAPGAAGMVPEQDACLEHLGMYAAAIRTMGCGELEIVREYASPADVRSAVRAPRLAVVNGGLL